MKITRSASGLLGLAMLLWTADTGLAQSPPEVRRARPMDEPPVARALPLEEPPTPVPRRSAEEPSEPAAQDTEAPDPANSTTRTRSLLASSTISLSRSIRNIWTITRAAPAGRTRIFRLVNALGI